MAPASRTMLVSVADLEQTEVARVMMVALGYTASGIQPGMALHGQQAFEHINREREEWCCFCYS